METYKVKVSYRVTRYQTIIVAASTEHEAKFIARKKVKNNTPDADIISVSTIEEKEESK